MDMNEHDLTLQLYEDIYTNSKMNPVTKFSTGSRYTHIKETWIISDMIKKTVSTRVKKKSTPFKISPETWTKI